MERFRIKSKNRRRVYCLLLIIFAANTLHAQKNKKPLSEELIGTWALVSVDNIYPDGGKVHPYGDAPQGMLIFDDKGNYAIQIYKALRPQIASGDKNKSTPDENAAMVQGSNAHFGKYLVDEQNKAITFSIAHASFPNWEGSVQKRLYTYTGNEIRYVVTHTTQGGQAVIAEVTWRRLH